MNSFFVLEGRPSEGILKGGELALSNKKKDIADLQKT